MEYNIIGSERVNAELPTPNTVCTAQIILFCSVCVIAMLFLLPYMYYYTFMHFIVATECTENDCHPIMFYTHKYLYSIILLVRSMFSVH